MHLDDEIALLRSVFQSAGDRFHLIGHSYGAAIALKAALARPDCLISLLLLTGTGSKASSLAVARLLEKVLSRVLVQEIEGVGHMAPVTHPERINPLIEGFLEATRLPFAGDAL